MMRLPLLLWLVSAVDLLRSVACIADPSALDSTSLWPLRPLGHMLAGALGVFGSIATMLWLLWPHRREWTTLVLAPQFIVLALGACSSLMAIEAGHYADGVVVTPAHIFTDQIVWILLPIFFIAAAVVEVWRSGVHGAV